jgi:dienelactone hydrolase
MKLLAQAVPVVWHASLALVAGVFLLLPGRSAAAAVAPRFDVATPSGGPFPSDVFTVADAEQRTSLRVNLPKPDCTARPNDCLDVALLNALDGFNVQPRLSIPFSGPIAVASVSSDTVFLLPLGRAGAGDGDGDGGGDGDGERRREQRRIGINEVVWDVATNTLHAEADELLDEDAAYLLVVTRDVRDAAGQRIERSREFAAFVRGDERERAAAQGDAVARYRRQLRDALERFDEDGDRIAVASAFTTMSVTAMLEKLRAAVRAAPAPSRAAFDLGAAGERTVFALDDLAPASSGVLVWTRNPDPPNLRTQPKVLDLTPRVGQLRLELCADAAGRSAACVGRIAFGKYRSPSYLTGERAIPSVPTRSGTPQVQGDEDVYFNLFLPAGPAPAHGWPVVIFGHGQGNSKNDFPFAVAAQLAKHGLATIAINMVSHGFGPGSTLALTLRSGRVVTFLEGGRGVDVAPPDGKIGPVEGSLSLGASQLLVLAHTRLQTTVDLMQLVRVIEAGVDVDGDGVAALDPERIYSLGFSAGSYVAAGLAAVEPAVRATVLDGTLSSIAMLRLGALRGGAGGVAGVVLASRTPPLINDDPPGTGLSSVGGVAVAPPFFNENMPLRDQAPVVNTVPGAMALQELFERTEWATQTSAPGALAPHLRRTPLRGVPVRPVLVTFARGDRTDVNPNVAAIVRAGGLADRTVAYRHDRFLCRFPQATLVDEPHRFLVSTDLDASAEVRTIALEAQEQAARFLASEGNEIVDPDGALPTFEVPFSGPPPEDLGFVFARDGCAARP